MDTELHEYLHLNRQIELRAAWHIHHSNRKGGAVGNTEVLDRPLPVPSPSLSCSGGQLWTACTRSGLVVGHSHNHPSCWLTLKTWPGPQWVPLSPRGLTQVHWATDLNSLMDQLAHVLVITHNTSQASVCASICPRPRRRFDVWRERTFDGRSVRAEQLRGEEQRKGAVREELAPIRLQLCLVCFNVGQFANLNDWRQLLFSLSLLWA